MKRERKRERERERERGRIFSRVAFLFPSCLLSIKEKVKVKG